MYFYVPYSSLLFLILLCSYVIQCDRLQMEQSSQSFKHCSVSFVQVPPLSIPLWLSPSIYPSFLLSLCLPLSIPPTPSYPTASYPLSSIPLLSIPLSLLNSYTPSLPPSILRFLHNILFFLTFQHNPFLHPYLYHFSLPQLLPLPLSCFSTHHFPLIHFVILIQVMTYLSPPPTGRLTRIWWRCVGHAQSLLKHWQRMGKYVWAHALWSSGMEGSGV